MYRRQGPRDCSGAARIIGVRHLGSRGMRAREAEGARSGARAEVPEINLTQPQKRNLLFGQQQQTLNSYCGLALVCWYFWIIGVSYARSSTPKLDIKLPLWPSQIDLTTLWFPASIHCCGVVLFPLRCYAFGFPSGVVFLSLFARHCSPGLLGVQGGPCGLIMMW